ncbi:MAG: hypothetical protein WBB01_22430 [Phormidesmis sp.]
MTAECLPLSAAQPKQKGRDCEVPPRLGYRFDSSLPAYLNAGAHHELSLSQYGQCTS